MKYPLQILLLILIPCLTWGQSDSLLLKRQQDIMQVPDTLSSLSDSLDHWIGQYQPDSLPGMEYLDSLSLLKDQINEKVQRLNLSIPDSLTNSFNLLPYLDSIKHQVPDSSIGRYLSKAKDLAQKAGYNIEDPQQLTQLNKNYLEYMYKMANWQPNTSIDIPQVNANALDQNLKMPNVTGMDLLDDANQQLTEKTGQMEGYTGKAKNPDQSIEQYAQNSAENQYFQENKGEFADFENMQTELQEQYSQPVDMDSLKNLWQQKKKVLANDFLLNNQDKIKPIQQKIKRLTDKYTQFNSAKDVIEGKEKPVKAKPKNRITWGTNFQFNPGDPVSVDLSPILGYRFNTRLSLNLGASLRYQLDRDNDFKPPTSENIVYGYRLFTEYKVIRIFYTHLEWERFSRPSGESRDWANAFMAGIGRQFSVTNTIQGNVVVMYNFLHNQESPHNNAFIIRFGFRRK